MVSILPNIENKQHEDYRAQHDLDNTQPEPFGIEGG